MNLLDMNFYPHILLSYIEWNHNCLDYNILIVVVLGNNNTMAFYQIEGDIKVGDYKK